MVRATKKGQTESYSFLIGIIITALILSIFIFVGVKILVVPTGTDTCFDRIVNLSKQLTPGQSGSALCDFDPEYLILGYDIGETILGNKQLKGEGTSWMESTNYKRPPKCPMDKPCLCLCKEPLATGAITTTDCLNPRCVSFDGFLAFMGINSNKPESKLPGGNAWSNEVYLKTIYTPSQVFDVRVEKGKFAVGICRPEDAPCIRGNLEQAYTVFQKYVAAFEKCLAQQYDRCSCDIFDFNSLGNELFIKTAPSFSGLEIALYQKDDSSLAHRIASKTISSVTICFYNRVGDNYAKADATQMEFSLQDSPNSNYIHKGTAQLYKYLANQICFAEASQREGFTGIGRRELSCEAKKNQPQQTNQSNATSTQGSFTAKMFLLDIGNIRESMRPGEGTLVGSFNGEVEADRVLSKLDTPDRLRAIGMVSRMTKSVLVSSGGRPDFRTNWFKSVYGQLGGQEKKIADKIVIVSFLGLYKQANQNSQYQTDKQDNFIIYYLSSSAKSKLLAEKIEAKLKEIQGQYYKDSAQPLAEGSVDKKYKVNTITSVVGDSGGDSVIFLDYTQGAYDNTKEPWNWVARERNDIPAVFIQGWEVVGDGAYMFAEGGHAEIFTQKIYEGVKAFFEATPAAQQPQVPQENQSLTLIDISDGTLIGDFDGKAQATSLAKQLEPRFAATSKVRSVLKDVSMAESLPIRRTEWIKKVYTEEAPQTKTIAQRSKLISLEAHYKQRKGQEIDTINITYLADSEKSKLFAEKVKEELQKISGKYLKDGNEYNQGQIPEEYRLEFAINMNPKTAADSGPIFTVYTHGAYESTKEPWKLIYQESRALPSVFINGVEVNGDSHYLFTGHFEALAEAIYRGWRNYNTETSPQQQEAAQGNNIIQ